MPEVPVPPRPAPSAGSLDVALGRLAAWRDDPHARVAGLVALALVAGGAWFVLGARGSPGGTQEVNRAPARAHAARPVRPDPSTTPTRAGARRVAGGARVLVHVAGAVGRPGLVAVPNGARVADAITAAGGPRPDADLDRLNLAAKLADGQRVAVPVRGAAPLEPVPGADPGNPAPRSAGGTGISSGPVNVNTASQAELEALPGIGPSLARAIIAEREKRGGFRSVDDLRAVRGIGERRLADLRPLVSV